MTTGPGRVGAFLLSCGAVAALGFAFATTAATAACTDTRCDPTDASFGGGPGEGAMVSANTWESSPLDGAWLNFGPERTWRLDTTRLSGARAISTIAVYISDTDHPDDDGGHSFALAAGNLALLREESPGVISVKNDTCASYFVRVVVTFDPAVVTDGGGGAPTDAAVGATAD